MLRGLAVMYIAAVGSIFPMKMTMSFTSTATARLGRRPRTCRWDSLRHSSHANGNNNISPRQNGPSAFFLTRCASTRASSRPAKYTAIYSSQRILPLERPADPSSLSSSASNKASGDINSNSNGNGTSEKTSYVQNQTQILKDWFANKQSVVCLTGAGMSTESGIPDYRGNKGSYFRGHKPIIHHEFMSSEQQRKRYWARSLVGYSPFANAKPNLGHQALASLEEMKCIGVHLEECTHFDNLGDSCFGSKFGRGGNDINGEGEYDESRRLSIITQNVDTLHSKAGVKHCLHLHGRGDLVKCMNCGTTRDRKEFHGNLMKQNKNWFDEATANTGGPAGNTNDKKKAELRPDGDAELGSVSYDELILPPCPSCGTNGNTTTHNHSHHNGTTSNGSDQQQESQSFFKTDVVFFGDSVPKHRFDISYAAIDAADGVLCIGTSLAVHSAFRLVKRAIENGTPVAILSVGETRVEKEGLGGDGLVTKLESPIGETLAGLVKLLDQE